MPPLTRLTQPTKLRSAPPPPSTPSPLFSTQANLISHPLDELRGPTGSPPGSMSVSIPVSMPGSMPGSILATSSSCFPVLSSIGGEAVHEAGDEAADEWLEARGFCVSSPEDDSSAPSTRHRLAASDLAAASPAVAGADGAVMATEPGSARWWPGSSIATLTTGISGYFGGRGRSVGGDSAATGAAVPAAAAAADLAVVSWKRAEADTAWLRCVQAVAAADARRAAAAGTTAPAVAATPANAPLAATAAAPPSPSTPRDAPSSVVRDHYEVLGLSRRATPPDVMLGRSRISVPPHAAPAAPSWSRDPECWPQLRYMPYGRRSRMRTMPQSCTGTSSRTTTPSGAARRSVAPASCTRRFRRTYRAGLG